MANTDAPHGFLPVRTLTGTGGAYPIRRFVLLSTNAVIGVGDPVVFTNAGVIDRGAATPTEGTFAGVAAEPHAVNDGASSNYLKKTIAVWCDPNIVFEAQTDDTTGTGDSQACVNNTFNYVAGTPANGKSIAELDESTGGSTTNTLPFKVLGLYKVAKNDFGQFNRLECVINSGALKGNTVGV